MTDSSRKVLVVDDEPELVETITELLDFEGIPVTGAGSVDQAIGALKDASEKGAPYTFIISDIQMPEKNGKELLKWVLGNESLIPKPYYTFMTGFSDDSEQDLIGLGAQKVLKKPFSVDSLLDLIASVH